MSAVPKLRFKEFEDDWEASQLHSAIASLDAGVSVNSGDRTAGEKELGILKTSCVTLGSFDPNENKVVDEQSEIIRLKEPVSKNSIIISRMNTPKLVGANAIATDHFSNLFLPDRLWAAKLKASVDPIFISILLGESRTRAAITARATGTSGSMKNITKGDILTLPVKLPSLPEQKKIADFLAAVDDKIAGLRAREDLLSQYKKGVMQKIFRQALRFKADDGSDFPDWEKRRADEVFRNHSNKDHDGKLPILAITQDKGAVLRSEIDIDIKSTQASVNSYKIVEIDDFIISLRSFQGGIEHSDVMGICSPAYTILKPNIKISNGFYKQYMKMGDFIQRLSMTVVGIRDGKQISYSAFSTLVLHYPHPNEQQKIADFLSAIDNKISIVSAQITQMQDFKKGLLQQMFV